MVDRIIASLRTAINPTSGTVDVNTAWETREQVKNQWEKYQALFEATEFEEDDEEAAETEFTERLGRYQAALGAARGLLESTGSEAGSLRQRTNSTSSQPGEEVVAALATPVHCKLAVKNAEVTIASHIQGLKDAVEQEDP